MKKVIISLAILLIPFYFLGCNNDDLNPEELQNDQNFFPIRQGQYWIYSIETQDYSNNGLHTESSFQQKISVIDSSIVEGESIYSLIVEERMSESDEWIEKALWQTYKNNYIAVLNKGSLPQIKLSFPMVDGKSWNINSMNAQPENQVVYDSLSRNVKIHGAEYANTITVVIENEDDPINITADDIAFEIYASDFGMVYQYHKKLAYKSCSSLYQECCDQNNINSCFDEIIEGSIFIKSLIEYGFE